MLNDQDVKDQALRHFEATGEFKFKDQAWRSYYR